MAPLVSVIIPHFNRSGLIGEAINSIEAQSYPHWEVIIIDDQSGDAEWAMLQRLAKKPKIRLYRRGAAPKGPSHCRNIGLKEASGDYVIFLDSDDLLAPWCLKERVRAFMKKTDKDLLVFPVLLFEEMPGDSQVLWNRLDGDRDLERFLYSDPVWCVSSPIWKKKAIVRLGGFNNKVLYGDDSDLHIRAILQGLKYEKINGLPDCFIRRSECFRITKGDLSDDLIRSRSVFLREVYGNLQHYHCSNSLMKIWEGEYFTEAEFLLFNTRGRKRAIMMIVNELRSFFHMGFFRYAILKGYFLLALFFIDRWYLVVRMLRRIAMLLQPRVYFSRPKSFHAAIITENDFKKFINRFQTEHKLRGVTANLSEGNKKIWPRMGQKIS